MATPTESIQQLYIAYYNRPADALGLSFWLDSLSKGATLASISKEFAKADEYKATYGGKSPDAVVATIYQNLFNRAPDAAGLNFWAKGLQNGTYTIDNIVETVAASAQQDPAKGPDTIAIQSKVAASVAFTDYLNTDVNARVAYASGAANGVAKAYVAGVSDAASLAAAIAPANLAAVGGNVIDGSSGVGTTYNSAISVDTFAGTAGNDTINILSINPATGAGQTTLGSFDSFNGGAGKDVVNIYADTGINNTQTGTFTGIETVNIYNANAVAADQFGGAAGVNASKFVGATAVWQLGHAGKVTGLGATTAAGFNGISDETLDVTASAATAAVALKDVAGDAAANAITLNVAGTKLAALNITGNIVKNAAAASAAAVANAAVVIGEDVTTFTLNTAVNTVLTVDDSGSAASKQLNTLAAGGSSGNVKFVGDADVTSITTGGGKDNVTLASALTATIKAGTVNTGAGNDNITVTATGTASAGNTVAVDAGAGNDKISVTFDTNVKYTVAGGAGDDTVVITAGTVKTTDTIDGGEGSDTIALAGAASYVADDYLVFTKVLKNFEAVEFTSASTGFDASQVASLKQFIFDAGTSNITKVAADQSIVSSATALTATAAGYTAAAATDAASTTVYSTATATGALKVAMDTDATTLTARANSVALTVEAASDTAAGNVGVTLTGDAKTASVALNHGVNNDDSFSVASVTVAVTNVTSAGGGLGANTGLGALTSLTLTGDGSATVTNTGGTFSTKLVTIDASGLNSVDADGAAINGLTFTSANTAAETIKLGGGLDHITLTSSTYGGIGATKADTITGLNLVLDATGLALDATKSDTLDINGGTLAAVKWTTTQTDLDLALKDAAAANAADAAHDTVVFAFGGNTYVMIDGGTSAGLIDAGDTVVKLTGTVNLDTLVIALA